MKIDTPQQEQSLKDFCREALKISEAIFIDASDQNDTFSLGGKIFRFQINNPDLRGTIFDPLEHLRASGEESPDARIIILDGQYSKTALPKFPENMYKVLLSPRTGPHDGQTIYFKNDDFALAFNFPRKHLSIVNFKDSKALFWIPDIDSLYPLDGRPFRTIFQWLLEKYNLQIVHAAGVGTSRGGVILTGKSGAGKSTVAAACLNSPLFFAGDENVILSTQSSPTVYSLYNSTNLDINSLDRLQFMQKENIQIKEKRIDKKLISLYQNFPNKMISQFPLRAVIVSQIVGTGNSHLERLSSAAALTALAPTSIFQVPGSKKEAFLRMSDIVKKTPCYKLSVGESLEDIPPLIIKLIEKNAHE
jgi:hypothetical protein